MTLSCWSAAPAEPTGVTPRRRPTCRDPVPAEPVGVTRAACRRDRLRFFRQSPADAADFGDDRIRTIRLVLGGSRSGRQDVVACDPAERAPVVASFVGAGYPTVARHPHRRRDADGTASRSQRTGTALGRTAVPALRPVRRRSGRASVLGGGRRL